MSDLVELRLGDEELPPWETPTVETAPRKDLEIYRKAENFRKLRLVSGNSIGCSVQDYVREHYGQEGLTRLKLATYVMKSLGYVPSDDALLMLSCTKKARVVVATAGAGKTTSLQLDLVISKMLDSVQHIYKLDDQKVEGTDIVLPSILYLNYNKHNVGPIYQKHADMCARVASTLVKTDKNGNVLRDPLTKKVLHEEINPDIESSTVHAFCRKWLGVFAEEIELPALEIMSDADKEKLWEAVIAPRWKKYYESEEVGVTWQTMDEVYTYMVEGMLDWEHLFVSAKFVDTGLNSDFVKACFKKYEAMKKYMKLLDFTDYLVLTTTVLREHPDLRARVQDRYKIIVADENQDFTALMNELLLQLYNPEKNRLIAVGDPDQTIYAFKGVSPDNVVSLVDKLEDVELLGLDTNYRCPDKIVDAAKAILNLNVLRFDKPIKTVKSGGVITKHPLSGAFQQANEVLNILRRNGEQAYSETVITYRNNRSSVIIGEELYYAGIPFSVLDDRRPFNNRVFRQIQRCLSALFEKDDTELNKSLYMLMPLSRELWEKILDANAKKRKRHLHDLIIPDGLPSGTTQAIATLVDISMRISTQPCSDFIDTIIKLYRKYYFDFVMQNPNPSIGDSDWYLLLLERAVKFWSRPYTFEYMQKELQERNVDKENAVTLSTFHGLKGLEFDFVIVTDFNDSIFPNYFGIEQRYPENTAMEEKESENRLCYVLVTRARKHVYLLYLSSNPSAYVDIVCPPERVQDGVASSQADGTAIPTLALGSVSIPGDAASAKLSFIQRLTGDRRK